MNLFLTIFLCDCRRKIIVPFNFIKKLNFAKTFNNRINRNQNHLVYFSTDLEDSPDFDLPVSKKFLFNRKACYIGKLLKAFDNLAEAKQYLNRRRNVTPAIYNSKRLKEKPIPPLTKQQNRPNRGSVLQHTNQPKVVKSSSSNAKRSKQKQTRISDPVNNEISDPADEWRSDTPPLTPEPHIPDSECDEQCETSEKDDVICVSPDSAFSKHRPNNTFDPLSGSLSFEAQGDLSRQYSYKKKVYNINKRTIDTLKYYNKSPNCRNNLNVDDDFVQLLLISFVPIDDLKLFKIDEDVMNLIKEFFGIRTSDANRAQKITEYIKEKCKQLSQNQ